MHHHFHSSSKLLDLARVGLKIHSELSRVASLLGADAKDFAGIQLATGDSKFNLRFSATNPPVVELTCLNGELQYSVNIGPQPGKGYQATATLTNLVTKETHSLDGAAFLRGEVPAQFRGLHDEVASYLKHALPEPLWAHLEQLLKGTVFASSGAEGSATPANGPKEETSQAEQPGAMEAQSAPKTHDEYSTFIVPQHNAPDIRFVGKLLHAVRTPLREGRAVELYAFQTKSGRFVGVQVGFSLRLGETNRYEVAHHDKLEGLADFFGQTPTGKALLSHLGVPVFNDIA